jgi:hypothetical protein
MISTFIGIAVHNATATNAVSELADLAGGVRQDATGLLGTTLQLSDLVSQNSSLWRSNNMVTLHDADLPLFHRLFLSLLVDSYTSELSPFYQREYF